MSLLKTPPKVRGPFTPGEKQLLDVSPDSHSKEEHVITVSMKGDYNNHSAPQRMAIQNALPLLDDAVHLLASRGIISSKQTLVVADYGCSHGGNSIDPIRRVIETARSKIDPSLCVAVYHTDTPRNNYNSLFQTIHESCTTYLDLSSPEAPVLVFGSATQFYNQILPPNSLHIGFSSSSTQWLSCFPGQAQKHHTYIIEAPEEDRAVWISQAREDWKRFLDLRTIELVPGGVLVLSNLCVDSSGDYTTKKLGLCMDLIIQEMVDFKLISSDLARRYVHPSYPRTKDEFLAPLQLKDSQLKLLNVFSRKIPNPLYGQFASRCSAESCACLDGHCEGDWKGFGEAMSHWCRAWVHVALMQAVSGLKEVAKQEVAISYFYRRVAEECTKRPYDHKDCMVMMYLVMVKLTTPYDAAP